MNKALAGDIPPEERSRLEAAGREIGRIVYTLPAEEIAVVDGPAFWAARTRPAVFIPQRGMGSRRL